MARRRKGRTDQQPAKEAPPPRPEPVDVVEGIPDRTIRPKRWHYLLLGLIFAAWVAFLVACNLLGAP
jgi:hypothetical protein